MNKVSFYTCHDNYDNYDNYYISSDIENLNKRNKKVEFSIFRDVIIIPKLSEICESIDIIWWSQTDKINAYKSMNTEIQGLQKNFQISQLKKQ